MSVVIDRPAPTPAPERPGGPVLGWRALLRLARRDALRHKGRSALVVFLIAIPVAALFLGAVLMRGGDLTDHQRGLLQLGATADGLVANATLAADGTPVGVARLVPYPMLASGGTPASNGDVKAEPLPAGRRATVVEDVAYGARVKLGDRYRFVSIRNGDLADPLLRGTYDIRRWRAPANDREAAVSIEVARRYGVRVGDTIVVRRGDVAPTVTGTYERADASAEEGIVTRALVGSAADRSRSGSVWVAATPGTPEATVRSALVASYQNPVVTRSFDDSPIATDRVLPVVILYTVGTIGLFVVGIVGIVVSAAFAVGARRQLRMLGLAGSNGASPRQLRLVVTAQGVVTGLVGVAVAAVLATGGLLAIAPHLNRYLGFRVPGLRVLPIDAVLVAGLAVLTAAVAAYLPARTAARVPTLSALAGRRPLTPVPATVPVLGVVLFVLGLLFLALSVSASGSSLNDWFWFSGSTLLLLLGTVLATPWLMSRLERFAGRLRGPARLAARGMARHRSRTGPICAAIVAAAGGSMAVATFASARSSYRSSETGQPRNVVQIYAYDTELASQQTVPADVVERVRTIVGRAIITRTSSVAGGDGSRQFRVAGATDGGFPMITTDEASLAAAGAPAEVIAAFRSGKALAHGLGPVEGERLTLESVEFSDRGVPSVVGTLTLDAVEAPALTLASPLVGPAPCAGCEGGQPWLVLPPAAVVANGWTTQGELVEVTTPKDLTGPHRAALQRLASTLQDDYAERAASGGSTTVVNFSFEGAYVPGRNWLTFILGGLVTVAALGVTAVGLALSAAEGRAELTTLTALGAPPRLRRRVRAWEALLTAGIGGVLAVPLGFLPAAVVLYAARDTGQGGPRDQVVVPRTMALLVAVGVPLLAGLVAYASGRNPRSATLRDE